MLPSRNIINSNRINRGLIAETGTIPAGMQLIQDTFAFEVVDRKNTVTEDVNGKEVPIMKVTGLFQQGDTQNANGRVYPTNEVLIPAVKAIQEDVAHRQVMGEYDHPIDAKIHLDRVSHLITNIWMEGRKVYGEAEVLHYLPCGAALRGLFEHKVRVGISSRGVGDMEVAEKNGQDFYNVLPGYSFVTFDAVAEPSVSSAILNIHENLNKRLRPVRAESKKRGLSKELYNKKLVSEINKFFDLK